MADGSVTPFRTAAFALFSLVILSLPHVTTASTETTDQCQERLDEVRQFLEREHERLSISEGIEYLLAHAGPACEGAWLTAPSSGVRSPSSTEADGKDTTVEVVPCTLGGAGEGRMSGSVLGFPLIAEAAVGTWEQATNPKKVLVDGEGGLVGGTQDYDLGIIRVGSVGLIPTTGDTAATCLKTTTVTAVSSNSGCTYVFLVFVGWTECATTVATVEDVTFEACSSTASQHLVVSQVTADPIVELTHSYEVADNPCEKVGGASVPTAMEVCVAAPNCSGTESAP